MKAQSDSPTASKESFKLLMAVAANADFKLASVDIRAAFLQSQVLDHDVFIQPPEDIWKPGMVWQLKKTLYALTHYALKTKYTPQLNTPAHLFHCHTKTKPLRPNTIYNTDPWAAKAQKTHPY